VLVRTIQDGKPMSRNQLFDRSIMGHRATYDALKDLNGATVTYLDQNKRVRVVPPSPLSREEARKELVRHCFRNFGVFTAENLSRYLRYVMPMRELRGILAELEKERFLVKGFLVDGDESVHWALKEDVGRIGKARTTEQFVLSPEDGLHTYLAEWIRQNRGGSYFSLIMDGPRMIGSFRGRIKANDIVLLDFQGTREARDVLNKHLRSLGLTVRVDELDTIPDWEVQEFYEKTHPGEV
jgi:ATP-dependent helicase Lhr and Lhr-like helicase